MTEELTDSEIFLDNYVTVVADQLMKSREIIAWLIERKIAVPIDDWREGFFIRPDTQISSAAGVDDVIAWLVKHGVETSQFICDYHIVHTSAKSPSGQRLWFLRTKVEISPLCYAEDNPSQEGQEYGLMAHVFGHEWPVRLLSMKEREQIEQLILELLLDYSAAKSVISKLLKGLNALQTTQEEFVEIQAFEDPSEFDDVLTDDELDEFSDELDSSEPPPDGEAEQKQLKAAIRDVVLVALRKHLKPTKSSLKLIH